MTDVKTQSNVKNAPNGSVRMAGSTRSAGSMHRCGAIVWVVICNDQHLVMHVTRTDSFYILKSVSKPVKVSGFTKRRCTRSTHVHIVRSLRISLVRSQLDYCNIISKPWQSQFCSTLQNQNIVLV